MINLFIPDSFVDLSNKNKLTVVRLHVKNTQTKETHGISQVPNIHEV